MIFYIRKGFVFCMCSALVMLSLNVNAQDSLVQNMIHKIDSYQNFSYQSINKMKDLFTSDTTRKHFNSLFIKAVEDKNFGYLFNVETRDENDKVTNVDLYNGQNIIYITPEDSTYNIQEGLSFDMQSSLPGCLEWIKSRLEKQSVKIVKIKDTTINAVNCSYLIATVYDTIIDKERNYTDVHLFIDELSGMPDLIIVKSRNTTFGNGISTYFSETRYFNYKVNQNNINAASIAIPHGMHQQKAQPVLSKKPSELLPLQSGAPNWTLYDSQGNKMSLAKLEGKIVLMDFFFIGCGGCMTALKPLSKLHEKYKNRNVAIVSMTFRDNKKAATDFKNNFNITYPVYIDASDVVKSYNVEAFPTFYFIDRKGKIANTIIGYDTDFEKKATSIIDNLLAE